MTTSDGAAQASREEHFRAVFDATYADLLRFAQRRADASHAEDITADVFLVAWRRIGDMPISITDARPWLFGVARATMLNFQRGNARREALAVRLSAALPLSVAGDDSVTAHLDLATAWERLTRAEQETISLTVWEGLSSAQAAVVLECSAVAYRLRLSRARRSLRRHLDAANSSTELTSPASNAPLREKRS